MRGGGGEFTCESIRSRRSKIFPVTISEAEALKMQIETKNVDLSRFLSPDLYLSVHSVRVHKRTRACVFMYVLCINVTPFTLVGDLSH